MKQNPTNAGELKYKTVFGWHNYVTKIKVKYGCLGCCFLEGGLNCESDDIV